MYSSGGWGIDSSSAHCPKTGQAGALGLTKGYVAQCAFHDAIRGRIGVFNGDMVCFNIYTLYIVCPIMLLLRLW